MGAKATVNNLGDYGRPGGHFEVGAFVTVGFSLAAWRLQGARMGTGVWERKLRVSHQLGLKERWDAELRDSGGRSGASAWNLNDLALTRVAQWLTVYEQTQRQLRPGSAACVEKP